MPLGNMAFDFQSRKVFVGFVFLLVVGLFSVSLVDARWSWDECKFDPCPVDQGDCDSDDECLTGYCANDLGASYGEHEMMDVCICRPGLNWNGTGCAADRFDFWRENGSFVYYLGDVGVGTSSPDGQLKVQQDDLLEEAFNIYYDNTNVLTVGSGWGAGVMGISNDGSLGGNYGPRAGLDVFIIGESTDGTDSIYGIKGTSFQVNHMGYEQSSYGGFFNASGSTALKNVNYGVYGIADNNPAYDEVINYGVYGSAVGSDGYNSGADTADNYGVYGIASGDQSNGFSIGVYAEGTGSARDGVFGVYSAGGINYFEDSVGIGVEDPDELLHIDGGNDFGGIKLDGNSGSCLMLRDTDNNGWTKCTALNGELSCEADSDGICD